MKPETNWDTPVQYLKTVGPIRARALGRLGIDTVADLLLHYPRNYFDRSQVTPIGKLQAGQEVTVEGEILTTGERKARRGGSIQTVTLQDSSGILFCVWFNQGFLLKQFRSGTRLMCSGKVQFHAGRLQLVHPDFEKLDSDGDLVHTGRLVPQYPLTQGIGQHWLRQLIHTALVNLGDRLPETLPQELLRDRGLCGRAQALNQIHFPAHPDQREEAHRRLVYEEIFLIQLTMALRRRGHKIRPGIRMEKPGDLTKRLVDSLPFQLTAAQRRVSREILQDLRSGEVMHRLLQGDVGSGKTLVALIAALFVIEQGFQAVLMAPTEVLARQHGQTVRRLVEPLSVEVAVLTGGTPAAERRAILKAAGAGEVDLLVGTHAVIQEEVLLPNLALSVVDEQHRFGVLQRGKTTQAGDPDLPVHVLVMSATPIPRSLSLTLYGDLDLSVIDELPVGRLPVITEVVPAQREAEVWQRVLGELKAGRQAFLIYPVIAETERQDLKAATVEYERLAGGILSQHRVALLHGRLAAKEKESIMNRFAAGEVDLLVATTVVEVGVDVPNVTVMVIHNPERFGLAQLHQLRGRIGRGKLQGYCYLLTTRWLAPETFERIRFLAAHNDGFQLAEEDLRRRGPGDIWGVRQHGLPGFRLANPLRDGPVVQHCSEDAAKVLAADPDLSASSGRLLRAALSENYGHLVTFGAG